MYLIIAGFGVFAIFLLAFFWPRQDLSPSAAEQVKVEAKKPHAKSKLAEVPAEDSLEPEPSSETAPEQIDPELPPKQEMDWSTYGVPAFIRMGRSF